MNIFFNLNACKTFLNNFFLFMCKIIQKNVNWNVRLKNKKYWSSNNCAKRGRLNFERNRGFKIFLTLTLLCDSMRFVPRNNDKDLNKLKYFLCLQTLLGVKHSATENRIFYKKKRNMHYHKFLIAYSESAKVPLAYP